MSDAFLRITPDRGRVDAGRQVLKRVGIAAGFLVCSVTFAAWCNDWGPFFRPTGAMSVGVPYYATTPFAPAAVARAKDGFAVGAYCGVKAGTTAVALGGDPVQGVLVDLSDPPVSGGDVCPATAVFVPVFDADRWRPVAEVKERNRDEVEAVARAAASIGAARR